MIVKFTLAAWAASSLFSQALVEVDFSHSYTGAPGGNQNTGIITLAFSVGTTGKVTLNASCVADQAAAHVDEFDGAVGSVSNKAIWGKNFTIILSRTKNQGGLRVDNTGSGLAVQGRGAQVIDQADEIVKVSVGAPVGLFELRSVGYAKATTSDGTAMVVGSDSYPLSGASGSVAIPAQLISGDFLISSASDADSQGFVLSGFSFDLVASPHGSHGFDNGSGDKLWTNAANWSSDELPVVPLDASIDGFDVVLDSAVKRNPAALRLRDGSLTISGNGRLSVASMKLGHVIESDARLVMAGSNVSLVHSGSSDTDAFVVGSAGTVETRPDSGGSSPLELGAAKLTLDLGSQWILDGANFTGPYKIGDRFVLANFGSFSGSTAGLRTRNFNLPANRKLQLVSTATSLYFEVVAQTAATGPNIIIVNMDDIVGGQHFGFVGRDCITPTLDSLVANGIHFTQAFAASTVCGPSRYSLMTGRWASRNTSKHFLSRFPVGTVDRFGVSDTDLEEDGQNLGAWLQQAGYRTGFVGKSHLTDDHLVNAANWPAAGLMHYPMNSNPAKNARVNGAMKHNHRVLSQMMRRHGFDYVSGYYRANLLELRNKALDVHNQEWITKNALDFIEENHSQRFFLYMAPTINHGPVRNDLTKSLRADPRYTSAGYLPDEDYSFMPDRQAIIDEVVAGKKDLISARETWIDYSIKAITDKLTAHGIRNDTLIIFTADHGEKNLGTPMIWGKSSLYDVGMRVPLVMNWPGGIAHPGRTYDESVSHVDFVPTLLELTSASALPTRAPDGLSLVPVLNGSSAPLRDDVFCEIGYARGVRTKKWKYIAVRYTPGVYAKIENGHKWENWKTKAFTEPRPYYTNNSSLGSHAQSAYPGYFDDNQLYDLVNDPLEQNNLYGKYPEIEQDLKKRLTGYLSGIPGRPFSGFVGAPVKSDQNDASE